MTSLIHNGCEDNSSCATTIEMDSDSPPAVVHEQLPAEAATATAAASIASATMVILDASPSSPSSSSPSLLNTNHAESEAATPSLLNTNHAESEAAHASDSDPDPESTCRAKRPSTLLRTESLFRIKLNNMPQCSIDVQPNEADKSDNDQQEQQQQIGLTRIAKPVNISFENLSLTLPNNKGMLLKAVSGAFQHSQIVAILGPSGSGKTTLLNTIADRARYAHRGGSLLFNGVALSSKQSELLISYVMQDDTLHPDLTVYENLMFSALLKLPPTYAHERKLRIVNQVIELLALEHVRHRLVGTIAKQQLSGGERKRVSIGVEIVADKPVILMDEITSSLDSTSSLLLLRQLHCLALLGRTIVMTIHQPRYAIFKIFDNVLFLARGGSTAYLGPTADVVRYFEQLGFPIPEHENAADYLLDVISNEVCFDDDQSLLNAPSTQPDTDFAAAWIKSQSSSSAATSAHFLRSSSPLASTLSHFHRAQPSWLSQYCNLLWMHATKTAHQWHLLVVDFIIVVLLASCIGFVTGRVSILIEFASNQVIATGTLGTCASAISLRPFGANRLQYWAEQRLVFL